MKIFFIICFLIYVPLHKAFSQDFAIYDSDLELLNNLIVIKSSSTLPVELIYFYAVVESNAINLKWGTATEVNNFGFEIERAHNAPISWETIDFVLGNGTSNVPIDYEYLDSAINTSGDIFYRLKQIDIVGSYEYSDTVTVNFINLIELKNNLVPQDLEILQIYPNPFNSTTNFQINIPNFSNYKLELFDISGQLIKTLFYGDLYPGIYTYQLNFNEFSSGAYLVNLSSKDYSVSKKISQIK